MLISRPSPIRTSFAGGYASAAPATAMTLSRLITASAMSTVRTAPIRLEAAFDVLLALVLGLRQLVADPEQQQAADEFQIRDRHQRDDDEGEDDAQDDGRAARRR